MKFDEWANYIEHISFFQIKSYKLTLCSLLQQPFVKFIILRNNLLYLRKKYYND